MYYVRRNDALIEEEQILRFVRLTENARAPTKSRPYATGFSLYSAYDYEIEPYDKTHALTDLQLGLPYGHYGRIASRWDLAFYHSIQTAGLV